MKDTLFVSRSAVDRSHANEKNYSKFNLFPFAMGNVLPIVSKSKEFGQLSSSV